MLSIESNTFKGIEREFSRENAKIICVETRKIAVGIQKIQVNNNKKQNKRDSQIECELGLVIMIGIWRQQIGTNFKIA